MLDRRRVEHPLCHFVLKQECFVQAMLESLVTLFCIHTFAIVTNNVKQ